MTTTNELRTITSTGGDGREWVLVDEKTGARILTGKRRKGFRGDLPHRRRPRAAARRVYGARLDRQGGVLPRRRERDLGSGSTSLRRNAMNTKSTDLDDAGAPEEVARILRNGAQKYAESPGDLQAAWGDPSAGRVWKELAKILNRAADSAERAAKRY